MKFTVPDVQFTVGEGTFTFRLSAKAWAALQDHWQLDNLDEALTRLAGMDSGSIHARDLSVILWAGLRTHNPEVTLDRAFELLDDMGVPGLMKLVQRTAAASFPEGGGDASGNPLWRRLTAAMTRGRSEGSTN